MKEYVNIFSMGMPSLTYQPSKLLSGHNKKNEYVEHPERVGRRRGGPWLERKRKWGTRVRRVKNLLPRGGGGKCPKLD